MLLTMHTAASTALAMLDTGFINMSFEKVENYSQQLIEV